MDNNNSPSQLQVCLGCCSAGSQLLDIFYTIGQAVIFFHRNYLNIKMQGTEATVMDAKEEINAFAQNLFFLEAKSYEN